MKTKLIATFCAGLLSALLLAILLLSVQPVSAQPGATNLTSLSLSKWLNTKPQTAITCGYQCTITPVGGLQYLTSSASRGTRLVVTTTVPAGTWLMFKNTGSFTITLTDTAPLKLSGNLVLGPGDASGILVNTGSFWEQITPESDN